MVKDWTTAKPREVEAHLREQVRKIWGDKVENSADIFAIRGYYNVHITLLNNQEISFTNFRKGSVPKIAKAMRALKDDAQE